MQTSEQKGAPKHVRLPMSTAASYSDIYTDGNIYLITLHLSPSQSTHTDESEVHGSLSTIDHFLGPPHMLSSISKCVVGEEDLINTSDHLPILAQMELCFRPHTAPSPVEPQNQMHSKPNWDKLSPMEIESLYTVPTEEQLSQTKCPAGL